MRLDGNSLRNFKFYFEIEIFSQYKASNLFGGLTPPLRANTRRNGKMGVFQKNLLARLKRMVEPYIWNTLKQNYRFFFSFITH